MSINSEPSYAVIGCGQGGHAFAAYLKYNNLNVSMYNRSHQDPNLDRVLSINAMGDVIEASGPIVDGKYKIDLVTCDMGEAIEGRDVIMVVTTGDAYHQIAMEMGPYLRDGQVIILHCSGIGGTLEFYETLRQTGNGLDVPMVDVDTLLFSCKSQYPGKILVKAMKKKMLLGGLQEGAAEYIREILSPVFPQFVSTDDPLEPGFGDVTCLHTAGTIFNSERILRGEDFNFYTDGITPEIAEFMTEMDAERVEVAKTLGIRTWNAMEWLNAAYGTPISDLYTMIQNNPSYSHHASAPRNLGHRFLTEEFPTKIVPQTIMAEILDVKTPRTDEIIREASRLLEVDLMESGRHLHVLGLTPDDIMNYRLNGLSSYRKRKHLTKR